MRKQIYDASNMLTWIYIIIIHAVGCVAAGVAVGYAIGTVYEHFIFLQ